MFQMRFLSKVIMAGRSSGSMDEPAVAETLAMPFSTRVKLYCNATGDDKLGRDLQVAQARSYRVATAALNPSVSGSNIEQNSATTIVSGLGSPEMGWDRAAQRTEQITVTELEAIRDENVRLYNELAFAGLK